MLPRLGVAAGVSVLTALLFGLAPAIAAAREDPGESIKSGGRGSSQGREHRIIRSSLVISEVALACLLLVCTGLLLRTYRSFSGAPCRRAWSSGRLAPSQKWRLRRDPWTYTIAAAILLLVAIAAGMIPAVRASRISPLTAWRIA